MAIEFSNQEQQPLMTPVFTPDDATEGSLRPRTLADYTGQERA